MLEGRRVVLAVTGGVAAYKSAYLARRLVEAGATVKVILTDAATEFIGAQTFAAITGEHPYRSLFDEEHSVSPHTELARWAELIVVAPATASTIGKVAAGISSDLVSATILAAQRPVVFAPAMHTEMWEHPSTRQNIEVLREHGYHIIGPFEGALAGGDTGVGRVAEPDELVEHLVSMFEPVAGSPSFLVTAGGTREPIDPVRYIGNRSSGKMGHAIADEIAGRGFEVALVTASDLPVSSGIDVIRVETAQEMQDAVDEIHPDVAIMAAAVADFRPTQPEDGKIARSGGLERIELEATPDILASVMARVDRPLVVGFAAETGDVERAVDKAEKKGVDLLVYNNVTEEGSGFGTDTNRVTLIDADGAADEWPLQSKASVATQLVDVVLSKLELGS